MSKPTVLSVLDLDPSKFGTMEEYMLLLSHDLRSAGCRSVLVFNKPVASELRSHFEASGATLEVLDPSSKARLYRQLVALSRRYQPHLVHFHFYEQFSFLAIVVRLLGAKLVVFTDHHRRPLPLKTFTKLQLRLWNLVVPPLFRVELLAVSEHIRRTLIHNYHAACGRVRVVCNGVNPDRFVSADASGRALLRAQLNLPATVPIIVTVAALIPEKGVADLLLAARELLASRPDSLFLVVGDGILGPELREQARQLGIGRSVRFLGRQSDVSPFMRVADVVVVPSVWQEPAGLVVLEAMASGRPVVATRVGGIPEYLQDGVSGLLVEPNSPAQLAAAILRLLASPELADTMGGAGRRIIEAQFSLQKWVRETMVVYSRVLAGRPMGR